MIAIFQVEKGGPWEKGRSLPCWRQTDPTRLSQPQQRGQSFEELKDLSPLAAKIDWDTGTLN